MELDKISNLIKNKRKEKGMTQLELAERLNVTEKAISRWETGRGMPDVSLLIPLSNVLDLDVSELLSGKEKNKNIINIDDRIKELQLSIIIQRRNQKLKYLFIILFLIILIIVVILKNVYFGYLIKEYKYKDIRINLGIPKASFNIKNYDRSYSYYNFSNKSVIKEEIKNYLKTLEYSICNDSVYYYDKINNISVIDYKVKDYILFSKVDMIIDVNDYCYNQKIYEYNKYIENTNYAMNYSRKIIDGKLENIDGRIYYGILLDHDSKNDFKVNVSVILQHNTYGETLEESKGTYEIRNNKYVYIRDEIIKKDNRIKIPTVSTFKIVDRKLILEDNYLSKYVNKVELESVK